MNPQILKNKNIVISASAEGIGLTIAEECLKNGAKVFLTDKNEESINKIQNHKYFKKKIFAEKINASDPVEVQNYFKKLKLKIDTIDVLVNNIGIAGPTSRLEDINISEWEETIKINVNSHFYYSKFSIPFLKKNKGGSIINISSTAGLFGFPFRSPYAASKWAVIGMTKTLAMELGKYNIRVNAICPGSVNGDRMKRVIKAKAKSLRIKESKLKKDFESMVSMNTFVEKLDVANMAIFLMTKKSSKITGQILTVDGNTERMN